MSGIGILLIRAISWFASVLTILLLARAVLSWFARDPYSTLGRAYDALIKVTEPMVAPCRNLLSRWNTGAFDFSVLLAFFMIQIIERVLVRVIALLFL